VSVQVSGPLSAASQAVYETAAQLTASAMALQQVHQFAVAVHLLAARAAPHHGAHIPGTQWVVFMK
jgi:hypothetical protein